ncbi:hypothetical protein BMH32_04630 [Leucobacter sp. OLJS4]|uniref:hypothetical protein n=1 Tax=Leucobacter sp. OLJS4 TaxID=1914922 RepID=UPI000C177582|nr:hypothetical protein [Leucobacter sp. OLJS4]PIJ12635.1 hypothetical protein BMH32_04630 [Leucobacter sp. OLJS4]
MTTPTVTLNLTTTLEGEALLANVDALLEKMAAAEASGVLLPDGTASLAFATVGMAYGVVIGKIQPFSDLEHMAVDVAGLTLALERALGAHAARLAEREAAAAGEGADS